MTYHEGEKSIQARAGVRDQAERVGRIINTSIPPVAAMFLVQQRFVIVSTVALDGAVTASLLGGEPGFMSVPDESTVGVTPRFGHLQTVRDDIRSTGVMAMLAIDFATRRRMRVNGKGSLRGDDIVLTTREVYSNCPQYIHDQAPARFSVTRPASRTTPTLDDRQRRWITGADTFFLASAHPEAGADASHRGGAPGFVRTRENRLSWPDYPGNNMFNTLGNLAVNPRAGLLFVDFAAGATLQLHGRANIAGERDRTIELEVTAVTEATF